MRPERGFDGLAGAALAAVLAATLAAAMLALSPAPAGAQTLNESDPPESDPSVVVRPGDSLWSISSALLGPDATPRRVLKGAWRIHALNRARIGADPDLILAGQQLSVPPAMSGRGSAPPAGVGAKEGGTKQGGTKRAGAEGVGAEGVGAEQDRAKRAGGARPPEDHGRSSAEEDVIRAFPGGDDIVHAEDGDGADTVDCGDGTDKAWVDAALDPSTGEAKPIDTVSSNCETVVEVVVPPNQARAEGASAGEGKAEKARPDAADQAPPRASRASLPDAPPVVSFLKGVGSRIAAAASALAGHSADLRQEADGRRLLGLAVLALSLLTAGLATRRLFAGRRREAPRVREVNRRWIRTRADAPENRTDRVGLAGIVRQRRRAVRGGWEAQRPPSRRPAAGAAYAPGIRRAVRTARGSRGWRS
jgi:hypothetical protein